MPHREEQRGSHGLRLANLGFQIGQRRGFQRLPTLSSGVADVKNHIADGVEIELRNIGGNSQLPLADHARVLERKIAFIVQIGFEQSAVHLYRTSNHCLNCAVVRAQILGIGIAGSLDLGAPANGAVLER